MHFRTSIILWPSQSLGLSSPDIFLVDNQVKSQRYIWIHFMAWRNGQWTHPHNRNSFWESGCPFSHSGIYREAFFVGKDQARNGWLHHFSITVGVAETVCENLHWMYKNYLEVVVCSCSSNIRSQLFPTQWWSGPANAVVPCHLFAHEPLWESYRSYGWPSAQKTSPLLTNWDIIVGDLWMPWSSWTPS